MELARADRRWESPDWLQNHLLPPGHLDVMASLAFAYAAASVAVWALGRRWPRGALRAEVSLLALPPLAGVLSILAIDLLLPRPFDPSPGAVEIAIWGLGHATLQDAITTSWFLLQPALIVLLLVRARRRAVLPAA